MPTLTLDQFGVWMIGLAALVTFGASAVGLALGLRRLLEPRAQYYATRAELLEVKGNIDKLQTYIQSRLHELANQMAPIPTQIAGLLKQQERLELKLDLNAGREEKILALFDAKFGDGTHGLVRE